MPASLAARSPAACRSRSRRRPPKNDEVFRYRGADRDARLVERAKQEGRVVLYTSLAPTESKPLAEAFEKKYGIKVELWRALSDKVVQRVDHRGAGPAACRGRDRDQRSGDGDAGAREAARRVPFAAPRRPARRAPFPAHRTWFPDRMNFFVVGYNTTKVQRSEIPATYEGFADPKWKGRIGLEATDAEWMATLIKTWGDAKGMDYFRKLSAMKPDVRKGHVLLADAGGRGRGAGRPHACTTATSCRSSARARRSTSCRCSRSSRARRASAWRGTRRIRTPRCCSPTSCCRPEGQQLFESMGRVPASTRVKSELNNFPFTMIDPATVLDEAEKWEKLWNELLPEEMTSPCCGSSSATTKSRNSRRASTTKRRNTSRHPMA